MATIKKSVGKYGKNDSADVVVVQQLLNKFITAKVLDIDVLVVDGDCGPKTKGAIDLFQRLKFGWLHPDGKVDAVGQTIDALNGPTWQSMKGDPLDELRLAIVEVLESPQINAIDFTLRSKRYQPGDFKPIKEFIRDRKIELDWNPGAGDSAAYFHLKDKLETGFFKPTTSLQKSVVVHEAVHAICDKRGSAMPVEEGEAVGHIAQCVYYRKLTGRHIREVTYAPTADVLTTAGNIAIDILAGRSIQSDDLTELYNRINRLPTTTAGAWFFYNGIS
jgi:hypothetical protein